LFFVLLVTLPDVAGLVLDAALELQPGTNGRWRFGCPRFDRWIMGIVAVRAVINRALTPQVCDSLTVSPEIPIFVAAPMTPATYKMRFIKVYKLVKLRSQVIAVR